MATAAPHDEDPRHPLVRLARYARPYAGLIALTLLLGLVFSGGQYLRLYLMKPVLDDVVLPHAALTASADPTSWLGGSLGSNDALAARGPALSAAERVRLTEHVRESFANLVAVALLVIAVVPLVQFARAYLVEYTLARLSIDLQRDVIAKLLALPLRFHRDRRRGDLLSRTMHDVTSCQSALTLFFDDLLGGALMLVVGVALLFAISWQLSALSLLVGPLVFGVIAIFGERIRRTARRRQEKFGDVTQRMLEILSGIKVIKAFRAEAAEERGFRRETQKLFRRSMRAAKNRVFARSLVEMLNNAIGIGMVVLGAWLLLRGRFGLTPGDLAAFAGVLATSYRPLKALAKGWSRLMDAQPSAERYFELFDAKLEIEDAPGAARLDRVAGDVRFRGVSFSYGREPVLRDVNLDVRAGEVVAVVGRTGAGKTTLGDLILRFYDPDAGSIEIDGRDLREIERDSLLAHVAIVSQEPFLFEGTIRENILYGRPDANGEAILAAAGAAHVLEFAAELPDGLDTEVGTEGARLSGGQRQRVSIARALLKDPAILIFDEATSALDAKSEHLVQDATLALLRDRTVFVIAHRLSTIRRADRIAVLENGRVAQLGTHAELTGVSGLYRELVELQTGIAS